MFRVNIYNVHPDIFILNIMSKYKVQRYNKTENNVLQILYSKFKNLSIHTEYNTPDIVQRKVNNKKPKEVLLFLDAETTNHTPKGNNRKIEFLLISESGKYYWIDAKHANRTTNITDLEGEYNRAKRIKGTVLYVVAGKGYTKELIKEHKKFLKEYKIKNVEVFKLKKLKNFNFK